jgi:cytochrome c5
MFTPDECPQNRLQQYLSGERLIRQAISCAALNPKMTACLLVFLLQAAGTSNCLAVPEGPRSGKPLSAQEAAAMDISVFPDGTGLPNGRGTPHEGKLVYETHCTACHGVKGAGGSAGELVGRSALDGPHPDQTVGNYWPYATTIFDFVRRSMPLHAPRSLSDGQIYAVTAYLLYLNGIIAEDAEMNQKTLPALRMPNRDGFVRIWPENP